MNIAVKEDNEGKKKYNLDISTILFIVNLLFQQIQCANQPTIIWCLQFWQQYLCNSIIWTNKMHCLLLTYFNNKPLYVSNRLTAHHQEVQLCIYSNWYSLALCWLCQLLYIQSWSSWWWAANLLETYRGLLWKYVNRNQCILLVHIIRIYHDTPSTKLWISIAFWSLVVAIHNAKLKNILHICGTISLHVLLSSKYLLR